MKINIPDVITVLFLLCLCSCSDSDEDVKNTDKNLNHRIPNVILSVQGKKLSSIDNNIIEYKNNFVSNISCGYKKAANQFTIQNEFNFKFPDGEFKIHDTYRGQYYNGIFSFNERGFLNHLEIYSSGGISGNTFSEGYTDTIKIDFNYTTDNFLETYNYELKWDVEGSSESTGKFKSTTVTTKEARLEWEDNNLISIDSKGKVKYTDYTKDISERYIINYSNLKNVYFQMPLFISQYCFNLDYPINILASIGLFGKGPEKFPSEILYYDIDSFKTDTIGNVVFDLNNNGSIRRETIKTSGLYGVDNDFQYRYK